MTHCAGACWGAGALWRDGGMGVSKTPPEQYEKPICEGYKFQRKNSTSSCLHEAGKDGHGLRPSRCSHRLQTTQSRSPRPTAIYFMHYKFARIHKSLRVTPAMATGVSHHVGPRKKSADGTNETETLPSVELFDTGAVMAYS